MKIGFTFGGYVPLHQGHMDLIMRAKKENDFCFVGVCGYEHEQRTEFFGLDLQAKTKLIKDFLEDDTLEVFSINDTELGLDESFSIENWEIWLSYCLKQMDETLLKIKGEYPINLYVGEPKYVEAINAGKYALFFNPILVDRTLNFVSGTMCRENPLKHWNKIMKPYKGLLSHNILIAGTASEGKTTLVNDISKYFGLVHSYEKGRDNCKWKKDNEFNFKDFLYNLYEQRNYNEELINSDANTGIFISDTDNLVTLMYAKAYAGREGFALEKSDYPVLKEVAKKYAKSTKWNKIFLLVPHRKPIVDDGERYMPDSDYDIRFEYYNSLKELYDEFGYEYEQLDGNYYENFLRVKEYIEGLYK